MPLFFDLFTREEEEEKVWYKERRGKIVFYRKRKGVSFSLNFVDGFQYFRGIQFARDDGVQHVLLLLHL